MSAPSLIPRVPNEARFFLAISGLAVVLAVVYWFASYELAGSVLLAGFALATGVAGGLLVRSAAATPPGPGAPPPDRPFLDETGRLPSPTLAPMAIGLGLAIAITGLVFGPAPAVVGLLPVLWGAAAWVRGATAELAATQGDETVEGDG